MDNNCCGTCKYHYHDKDMLDGDFVCTNPDSDYIADYTEYNDWCGEYEERECTG